MIKNSLKKVFFILLEIITTIAFLIIFTQNTNEYTYYISLLPMSYLFLNLVFFILTKNKNMYIGTLIINISYFIRTVITPLFMILGNYFTDYAHYLNYDEAIFYVIYEMVLVFIILIIGTKSEEEKHLPKELNTTIVNKNFKYIVIILSVISIFFVIRYPAILNNFKFGFLSNSEMTKWYINYNKALTSVPRIVFYLITWILTILKELYILLLLIFIKNSKIKSKVLFSFIVVALGLLISTGTLADSLYFAIIYFILILDLYKQNYKKILSFCGIGICLFLFFGLFSSRIIEGNITQTFLEISKTFQAYFGGITNVANSLTIKNYNTIEIILGDFLRSIPLVKAFFVDYNISTNLFNSAIADQFNSQIIPALGQSYLYFGKVLSPLFACIFTFFTVKFEANLYKEKDIYKKFLLALIIIRCACVPVIYNYYIFLMGLFGTYAPLRLIFSFNKRRN